MKRLICILVLFGGILLCPTLVSAHAGPGPPFLKVNTKYAQTNQYYQGDAAINIPQDSAPEKYLVNSMLLFEVDTSQLLVPPDIAEHTLFRWTLVKGNTFADNEKTLVIGMRVNRSFNHIGSYLLTLEAQGPGEYTYNTIDTVQVDIVPKLTYQTPKLAIEIGASSTKNNFSAIFVSKPTVDPTSGEITYLWDLGDKKLATGMSQSREYTSASPINYLYNRIIDSNGFSTDIGFDVWKNDTNLEFHPFGNMLKAPMHIQDIATVQKKLQVSSPRPFRSVMTFIGVGIFVVFALFLFFKPKKVS